ncbi:unnamed protein product [Miscanthus lutarioriparius]|uniref:Uncharacterized protein n=1 Tax=Miscanthus lutarioriparius TaxID=422564 RepID=A0A811PN15_9POAL|nr:unnamed protein product [Miscanthus lutarioriparius]
MAEVLRSMASLPIKPLDGAGGYLRWKESLLLRVHTLGVAHVLFEACPAGAGAGHEAATAKKWARDDAVPSYWRDRFDEFRFDRSTGDVFLEQLAHAEALGAAAELSDGAVAFGLRRKIPATISLAVTRGKELESIWEVARSVVSDGVDPWNQYRGSDDDDDGPKPEQNTSSRKRAMSEHVARRRA